MNINDVTIGQAKEFASMFGNQETPCSVNVGETVYIRTVTNHYLGRVVAITSTDFKLEDASWVADSGRWAKALKTGELSEVEPYPDTVIVMRGAMVDVSPWNFDLPREVK